MMQCNTNDMLTVDNNYSVLTIQTFLASDQKCHDQNGHAVRPKLPQKTAC